MKHSASLAKYLQAFRLTLLEGTAFRLSFLLSFLHVPLLLFIYWTIWSPGFAARGEIQGYAFPIFITGLMTSVVLRNLTFTTGQGEKVEEHIQHGSLLVYLTRPISFFFHQMAEALARIVLKAAVGVPALLLLHIALLGKLPTLENSILAAILVVVGGVVFYELTFIMSIASFWIGESWGLRNLIGNLGWLFGGAIVPVTFFPESLRLFSAWLPFEYGLYTPSELLLGRAGFQEFVFALGVLGVWAIILFVCQKPIWEAGLRKHDGKG
ncbi:MAG: ABC-2 family transporter protein [Candidatus Iainarchaeum archaeon]|uniref:ABC-2 family transporter protein n=1 Tax=Candidatus Iainarchaeum sp. TaxID=3101447 RepID=A0A7T9I1J4_9ARCH|nr:MAG: ABC-2 family transporter protein [Candidatus Diapherotrites archaeon]